MILSRCYNKRLKNLTLTINVKAQLNIARINLCLGQKNKKTNSTTNDELTINNITCMQDKDGENGFDIDIVSV